jgi:hypothetical protein
MRLCRALSLPPDHDAFYAFEHLKTDLFNFLYIPPCHTQKAPRSIDTPTSAAFRAFCALCAFLRLFAPFCAFLRPLFVLLRLRSGTVPHLFRRDRLAEYYEQAT